MTHPPDLSRRRRQILDVVYRQGAASVADVQARLPDRLSDSAVRRQLHLLEAAGHVRHRAVGSKNVYRPAVPVEVARQAALRHLVETFFGGSVAQAIRALLPPA